jgi:NADP-dependent aldehyde dehydrogenase
MTTTVESIDVRTGEATALDVIEASPGAVRSACERAAQAAPELARRDLRWRAGLLGAMASALEEDGDAIVQLADRETALGLPRLAGELRRTVYQLRLFARVVEEGSFLGATIDHAGDTPMGPLPDVRRMVVPLGPVAVFGASNFPLAFSVPGGDTASAIAAGCPVVIKAHPAHPATSEAAFAALARAASSHGAPNGTVALVHGFAAGIALVEDPDVAAVGFTGSGGAGRALFDRASARPDPIPFYGELGAANALVVTPLAAGSRGEEIGAGAAQSLTLGVGQFCTQPGLLFVPEGAAGDALVASLVAAVSAVPEAHMLTTSIAAAYRSGVQTDAAVDGVRTLLIAGPAGGTEVTASLFETTASSFAADAAAVLRRECFGPVSVVVRYGTTDDLDGALGVLDPALTFTIHAEPGDPDAQRLIEHASRAAGRVVMNGYPTGVGVNWAMQHGGPWPATTSSLHTSVGAGSIARWLRPVAYQGVPDELLPAALREGNPLGIPRRVDGRLVVDLLDG